MSRNQSVYEKNEVKVLRMGDKSVNVHIIPEFRDFLPQNNPDIRAALKEDIRVYGFREQLTVGRITGEEKLFLVDGHHRLAIGEELNNELATSYLPKVNPDILEFENCQAVKNRIVLIQDTRRNVDSDQVRWILYGECHEGTKSEITNPWGVAGKPKDADTGCPKLSPTEALAIKFNISYSALKERARFFRAAKKVGELTNSDVYDAIRTAKIKLTLKDFPKLVDSLIDEPDKLRWLFEGDHKEITTAIAKEIRNQKKRPDDNGKGRGENGTSVRRSGGEGNLEEKDCLDMLGTVSVDAMKKGIADKPNQVRSKIAQMVKDLNSFLNKSDDLETNRTKDTQIMTEIKNIFEDSELLSNIIQSLRNRNCRVNLYYNSQ